METLHAGYTDTRMDGNSSLSLYINLQNCSLLYWFKVPLSLAKKYKDFAWTLPLLRCLLVRYHHILYPLSSNTFSSPHPPTFSANVSYFSEYSYGHMTSTHLQPLSLYSLSLTSLLLLPICIRIYDMNCLSATSWPKSKVSSSHYPTTMGAGTGNITDIYIHLLQSQPLIEWGHINLNVGVKVHLLESVGTLNPYICK